MAHSFRLAMADDKQAILAFLAAHWSRNHVFLRDQELFQWQYQSHDKELNFMLAVDDDSQDIIALLGFIPTSRFDPALEGEKDVWGAIWKNAEGRGMAGLQLLISLQKELGLNTYAGIGLSEDARKIYRQLGYQVGDMEHYFIPLPDIALRIASIPDATLPDQVYPDASLRRLSPEELLSSGIASKAFPRKTPRYIYERYVTHPRYNYDIYEMGRSEGHPFVIVTRTNFVEARDSACLHIVDWLGPWDIPLDLRAGVIDLLREKKCEYADLVCKVEEDAHFSTMGFRLKKANSETIPLHFAPFNDQNIPLHYVVKTTHPSFTFFKGDSDQDRPN